MGRAPCCAKVGLRRGRWTTEEDQILSNYIHVHGEGSWRSLPKNAGLLRCGKSCRLRWINYLRSDLKRGNISAEEEELILKLHASLGNRWSLIAGHLGRKNRQRNKKLLELAFKSQIHPLLAYNSHQATELYTKIKKPRKKTSTPSSEPQTNMVNPSVGGGGEVMHDSSTSGLEREKENGFDDCFYDESLLMDPTAILPLTDHGQDDVINHINSSSSSTNDSSQVNQVDWGWEWNFEDGDSMLGLGFGVEEDDDIMSWPWESPEEEQVGVDVQKQDAMIAWLLS